MSTSVLDKVAAFVTRDEGESRELLVFRHPTAGVQLPAGTVEPGETVEAAVLREVAEETGLTAVILRTKLATLQEDMEPKERMLLRSVRFRTAPETEATCLEIAVGGGETVPELGRGNRVRVKETTADYTRVVYEVYDIQGDVWRVAETTTGWIPSAALTGQVERHLFHLQTTAVTPDRRICRGDADHDFQLYWVPLTQNPGLVRGQDPWLETVVERLRDA